MSKVTREQYLEALAIVEAYHKQLNLQQVNYCDLQEAKIGDKIVFSKVYPQSKRYTVGKEYEFIREEKDLLAVRDDRGRISWIRRDGISYHDYKVIRCRH